MGRRLDRAVSTLSIYRSLSIRSGLAAILNAMLLPAAVTHVRRIAVSYPSVDSGVHHSVHGTAVNSKNRFYSMTGMRTLAFGMFR